MFSIILDVQTKRARIHIRSRFLCPVFYVVNDGTKIRKTPDSKKMNFLRKKIGKTFGN